MNKNQLGQLNPNWKGGTILKKCLFCSGEFRVIRARKNTAKFCSIRCKAEWQRENEKGENNPKWIRDGIREKKCKYCGATMRWEDMRIPLQSFTERKFCSKECIRLGQKRYEGKNHPKYKPNADHSLIKRVRVSERQSRWSRKVMIRDDYTCQNCKKVGGDLHAHHIKPFIEIWEENKIKTLSDARECKELWEIDNGITLCKDCHYKTYKFYNNQYTKKNSYNEKLGEFKETLLIRQL
jgi:5-methylcytosine-specific restriction endonuclease McrA